MKLTLEEVSIRLIEQNDNAALANVIRQTLKEFGANHPGTVYYDQSTDHLFELFQSEPRSVYFVAVLDGQVVGGGGIYPSPGLPSDTCELVKMYLLPQVRGIGLGRQLIQKCIDHARTEGFKNVYIETMPELNKAVKTYEKFGFRYLNGPMGDTGHYGCALWMLLEV